MLTTQAMGQLKERERDAETNRNLEQWIKENAALGKHVTMQRSVLGDPPVRWVSAMYVGDFNRRGAMWTVIRYSRDGHADILELQKNGERVGPRVTCSLPEITEKDLKKTLRNMN